MKEFFLHKEINNLNSERLIQEISIVSDSKEEMLIRINSQGGDVFSSVAVIDAIQKNKELLSVQIDGLAGSVAAFIFLSFPKEKRKALELSSLTVHRAVTENPEFENIVKIHNEFFETLLLENIDENIFKSLFGLSIGDLFSLEERKTISISYEQMLSLGILENLVNNQLTTNNMEQKPKEDEIDFKKALADVVSSIEEKTKLMQDAFSKKIEALQENSEKSIAVISAKIQEGKVSNIDQNFTNEDQEVSELCKKFPSESKDFIKKHLVYFRNKK